MNMRLLFLLGLLLSLTSAAQPGSLDLTYGTAGIATIAGVSSEEAGSSLAIQQDQKTVVAGYVYDGDTTEMLVARFNTDGTLDNSFNGTGTLRVPIAGSAAWAKGVVIQPDQRIVVAGTASDADELGDAMIARINTDGSMDASFGSGGVVTTSFGPVGVDMSGLALQTDGKLLVVGTLLGSGTDVLLLRYNVNGSLDNGFGTNGSVVLDAGADETAYGIALQPDGSIVVCGSSGTINALDVLLCRFTVDGTPDTGFGNNGLVLTDAGNNVDQGNAVLVSPDGRILVAGGGGDLGYRIATVLAYLPNGSLDPTFGVGGIVVEPLGVVESVCRSIVLQTNGAILCSGVAVDGGDGNIMIVRFLPNGALDNSFSDDGYTFTNPSGAYDDAFGMAIQSDGAIVVCGSTSPASSDVVVLRYINDLNVDVVDHQVPVAPAVIYPNPTTDQAVLVYELIAPARISVVLSDVEGRLVRTFFSNVQPATGAQRVSLDLSGIAAGHYALVLTSGTDGMVVPVIKE